MNYGVIAEFNPFHNGHRYLFDTLKKHPDDTVTAVMSESFVQRGECAVVSAAARAECALRGGADLVLSLPVRFALSGAQSFARGGVGVLSAMGIIDCLAFGSECGSAPELIACAAALQNKKLRDEVYRLTGEGSSYPAAQAAAVSALYGDRFDKLISSPNDILALEYIKALKAAAGSIKEICAVRRCGAAHDSSENENGIASASFIRQCMKNGIEFSDYVPESTYSVLVREASEGRAPSDIKRLEEALLYKFRTSEPGQLLLIEGIDIGLANRICDAARKASSLEELYDTVKTKCYTHSNIRRVCLRAFLGMSGDMFSTRKPPEYIRVLGFNKNGEALLSAAKRRTSLPIVTKVSEIRKLGVGAQAEFDAECTARDIFSLALPQIQPCGLEMTEKIVIINSD